LSCGIPPMTAGDELPRARKNLLMVLT
jgi:hypothetical protein